MAFEPKKFSELYDAMRAGTTALTDFEVGSVARTMYESFAYELGLLYQKMELVYLSAYVDSAQGTHLDQVVAVLGIQRSLPDFAVGEVVFLRDKGNAAITIPAGMLIATEDTPENPKKVYQTLESAVISESQLEVSVKIQAVDRGEELDTAAESVVVMPRPIPGIKSVNNPQPIRLVGRSRETDDELRRRAKNALLSSGKANLAALENAVLSLPGVLDVKVREDFHFAKGLVSIHRAAAGAEALIAKGAIASTGTPPGQKRYRLLNDVLFSSTETDKTGQFASLLEGREGELPTGQSLQFEDSGLSGYTLSYTKALVQSQFGMADVVVDTPDFASIRPKVYEAIEAVRAAGIFVNIMGAQKVEVDGVFRIETAPNLNLSPEERTAFEVQLGQEIEAFFQSVKMGQPLLFSKMMKAVLSVEGVDNLAEFQLMTRAAGPGGLISRTFELADNKIEAEELERFYPTHLCVASEDKRLPVNITFQANSLDDTKLKNIKAGLEAYLNGLPLKGTIVRADIVTNINNKLGSNLSNLLIRPISWCPNPNEIPNDTAASYTAKFVEKPVLGKLFGYQEKIELDGALLLLLPDNTSEAEKNGTKSEVTAAINGYLDKLEPEADIAIDDLLAVARSVKPVLEVRFDASDLVVRLGANPAPDRIKQGKIDLKAFEKAFLGNFPVVTDIFQIKITVTKVTIKVTQTTPAVNISTVTPTVRSTVEHTINTFLAGYEAGQDLLYNDLKSAIQNLSLGFSFLLTDLNVNAVSDSSMNLPAQSATINKPSNITIRSVELPTMVPVTSTNITITT